MRDVRIDALRGLAIILMVIDHVAVVFAPDSFLWRETFTRLAMPLFAYIAGNLFQRCKPWNWQRISELVFAALLASLLGGRIGLGQPDILWYFLAGFVLLKYVSMRWWWFFPGLLAVQATTWPVAVSNYQPGVVWVIMWLGFMDYVEPCYPKLPGSGLFAWIGRAPLVWYVGHIFVLWCVVSFVL